MVDKKEVAVIGLGPGGVSAAIYLKRYGMVPYCFEKELVGGKVNKTEKIENYAGVKSIGGPDLGMLLESQLKSFDIKPIYKTVKRVSLNEDGTFHVEYGKDLSHDFQYVLLANGLGEKPFPIEGEETFHKRGISRCAICDGPLYKGKDVAVIGAGNSAFEEATYLASICNHVTLIARRTQFRADQMVVDTFKALDNVTLLAPYDVVSATGSASIESLKVRNKETMEEKDVAISGLFLFVGDMAISNFVDIPDLTDEKGYLITDSNMMTKVKNLYAAGDCRTTPLRQVATATSDGALAATMIHNDYQKNN